MLLVGHHRDVGRQILLGGLNAQLPHPLGFVGLIFYHKLQLDGLTPEAGVLHQRRFPRQLPLGRKAHALRHLVDQRLEHDGVVVGIGDGIAAQLVGVVGAVLHVELLQVANLRRTVGVVHPQA